MSSRIERLVAAVKLRRQYVCEDCGCGELGDTERYDLDVANEVQLASAVKNLPVRAHYMPVGWSSGHGGIGGGNRYTCGCKKTATPVLGDGGG
jgi:hypothetical protein